MNLKRPSITHIADFETFGTDPFKDGIGSVSARTFDVSGNQIDDFEVFCKSEKFRLAHPEALMINGISSSILANGEHPIEASKTLYDYFVSHGPSQILAWNASFDFKFSFMSFYQALMKDPYLWKRCGNNLICMMEVIRSIEAFEDSEKIIVPKIDGFYSFKQIDVAMSSGIFYQAHSSTEDIKALEKIWRIVRSHHMSVLEEATFFAKKSNALNFAYTHPFFVCPVGFKKNFSVRPLVPLAKLDASSELVCFDISVATSLEGETYSPPSMELSKQLSENPKISFPFVLLPLNKSKILKSPDFWQSCTLSSEFTKNELEKRASAVWRSSHLQDLATRSLRFREMNFQRNRNRQLEYCVFDGFPTNEEKRFMYDFANTPTESRFDFLIDEGGKKRNRFHMLARRFLLDAYPEFCPPERVFKFREWCRSRLGDSVNQGVLTFDRAFKELSKLANKYPGEEDRLRDISVYLHNQANSLELDLADVVEDY